MKYLSLLFIIIIYACSPKQVLKTDTSNDIDLSGRWNKTDAEIVTNELFNNLIDSRVIQDYSKGQSLKPRISVRKFDSNFKNGGENLVQYFIKYAKASELIEYTDPKLRIASNFYISGSIEATEYDNRGNPYIEYNIQLKLLDSNNVKSWEDNSSIKKYIKE
ncbi:hypothetical protein [Marivirga arenosa]|uniref:Penicillin-binding protein activator LpoB n=1 Tax=Marivirga arenosa TaxID=3059076 RepID=A0AA51ZV11_9BACT|nr:hypothetical protein [Marivirga sp. BKB1-2]WNB16962.1 hypothetical protein QYS47_32425 [Marivirga sp. BKB1-2]